MSTFNLFVYGTLRRGAPAHERLSGCEYVADAAVGGMLYDIDGRFPALLLYGDSPVHGEVWRCPAAMLPQFDEYEGRAQGLFRRVGVHARTAGGESVACWAYTAGPALSQKLRPDARLPANAWPQSTGAEPAG